MNALPEPNARSASPCRSRIHADRADHRPHLSLLIGGVVVAALITSLNVSSSTSDQISDSADAGLLTSFLTRDAQSSGAIVPNDRGARHHGWCIDVGLGWLHASTTVVTRGEFQLDRAHNSPSTEQGRRHLRHRRHQRATHPPRVRDSSTGVDVILARHLAAAVATCDTTNCSGTPVSVSLTVTGSATRSPFAYTLKASLRGDTRPRPRSSNSTPVPLLALGSGAAAVCPNVDIAGTGVVTVVGTHWSTGCAVPHRSRMILHY